MATKRISVTLDIKTFNHLSKVARQKLMSPQDMIRSLITNHCWEHTKTYYVCEKGDLPGSFKSVPEAIAFAEATGEFSVIDVLNSNNVHGEDLNNESTIS